MVLAERTTTPTPWRRGVKVIQDDLRAISSVKVSLLFSSIYPPIITVIVFINEVIVGNIALLEPGEDVAYDRDLLF